MSCNYSTQSLVIDQALLNVTLYASNFGIQLWTQSTECDQCSLTYQKTVFPNTSATLRVNSKFSTIIQAIKTNSSGDTFCRKVFKFGEWGEYHLEISPKGIHEDLCFIHDTKEPVNGNLDILWAFLLFFGMSIFWCGGKYLYRKRLLGADEDSNLLVSDLGSPSERRSDNQIWTFSLDSHNARLRERLRALDALRGICIVVMIFVNYGGGRFWFFQHSSWNGLTVADLVFPWFMFIMGTSIALQIQSKLRRAVSRPKVFLSILKRSAILFILQLMLNSQKGTGCELSELRLLGVLQRFAVTYFFIATLQLLAEKPGDIYQFERWASMRDIFPYWFQWIFIICVVALHCCITFLLPVPGCPTGYLGPGGLHLNSSYENCTGGAAGYIDRLLIGENHMYKNGKLHEMYETTIPYDPEGVLGYLTSLLVVFLGLQAGKIIALYPLFPSRVTRWLVWAVILGATAAVLCKASQNDGWIPVNKNLWSLSFVLATSSMAFVLLTICYVLVDIVSIWSGAPFIYPGMNSILLYVGHEITAKWFPWSWPVPNTHMAQLSMDLWGVSLWVIISYWLHECNFFLSV